MRTLRIVLLLCLAGLMTVGAMSCAKVDDKESPEATGPKILRVRLATDIKNLDPALRYTAYDDEVANPIFSGLVTYAPNSYDIKNDLATEFEVSEDGKEIYFKLREGVQFHKSHGEVTAEDVKYSYERFLDPEVNSQYRDDWAQLSHVEVISKYEGTIVLKETFSPLMASTLPLNSGAIVPKDYVEEVGLEKFATDVIGTGPYYLDRWEPNQKVVLKRNPDYFGETPYWDEIHLIVIPDHQSAEIALRSGEIDFGEISPDSVLQLEGVDGLDVLERPNLSYRWIGMNVENPKLQDVNVRKAIIHTIDVPSILNAAYNGLFDQATGLIAPGLTGYWEDAPVYTPDIDKAKEYMSKAGLPGLDLRLDVMDELEYRTWGEIAQENLKQIGINLEINPVEFGTYWEMGIGDKGKEIELFAGSYQMQPDPSWATMWFTSSQIGEWNWMRWGNEEFDRSHAKGTTIIDLEERQALYERMQQLMDEDAIAIWITHGKTFFGYNPDKVVPSVLPHNQIQYGRFGGK